jgi:tetratricopeptide (TPR) repeat protein
MASNKTIINLIFGCVAVALGLTAITSISRNSSQPAIRAAVQTEPAAVQMPENHPSGDVSSQIAVLQQLSAKEPQNANYRTQIGNLYYDLGQYDKAADYYRQSLTLHPQDPSVETDMATCYHYLGQHDKALEILNKVLKYSPNFSQAMFNKGIVLSSGKNDRKGAIAVWEDLLRTNPGYEKKAELEEKINQYRSSIK